MIKDLAKNTIEAKLLYATAGGFVTNQFIESEQGAYVLMVVGIFISLLSYIYEFAHSIEKQKNTKLQTITEVIKYALFGGIAMPSVVIEAGNYVDRVQTQLLIGVFIIWSIIYIYDAAKKRVIEFIKEFKK